MAAPQKSNGGRLHTFTHVTSLLPRRLAARHNGGNAIRFLIIAMFSVSVCFLANNAIRAPHTSANGGWSDRLSDIDKGFLK